MPERPSIFHPFEYTAGSLACGGCPLGPVAETHGTPLYVYAADGLAARYTRLRGAFVSLRPEIRFAAKSCGNIAVLTDLVGLGAGIDVVSGGELERAWLAGCPMDRVAFAGVGKSRGEILAAIDGAHSPLRGSDLARRAGRGDPAERGSVGLLNIESAPECERIDGIARELGRPVRVAVRVNPDVDARTHPFTTTGLRRNKFGIDVLEAEALYRGLAGRAASPDEPGAHPIGLHVHIGSPVHEVEPYVRATRSLVESATRLRDAGAPVELLDLGGGWPSPHRPEDTGDLEAFADALTPVLAGELDRGTRILLEPGRSVVANAGVLLTRVEYIKRSGDRRFVIVDAGMHTLIRPALYQAEHAIWPVRSGRGPFGDGAEGGPVTPADVVGPVCETGDFLARGRPLPEVGAGDLLAVFGAGAYGMSMAMTYNQHPRPAEVMIEGARARLIRRRESVSDLIEHEVELP